MPANVTLHCVYTQRLSRKLSEQATHLRLECVNVLKRHELPPSNITKEEREALQTLKKDSNVMILPADKGRATVILNTADYKTKCQDLLNDKRTYKQLKKDPTNMYRTKLINLLKELKNSGAITQEQWGDHTRTVGRSHRKSGAITQEQWGDHTRTVGRSHKNSGAITQEQ